MKLIKYLLNLPRKIRNRWVIAKAYPKLKEAYQQQLKERKALRVQINLFLRDYFGINGKSKYIPKDFKNKEEVKIAVCEKFQPQMDKLNLKYTDLFS